MVQLGNLNLKNRIFLAPMLEPNDIAFRLLCKKAGVALTFTGMISPLSKNKLNLDDKPVLQLFGNSPKGIKEFIKKYDERVSGWDFNLGCPSKLSKKLAHGAFMHRDFENIERILKEIRTSTKKFVSIKLRKSPQAVKIAKFTEKYVDAVGIHPRTSQAGYSGKIDYGFALKLKKGIGVPVIYSGDVTDENIKKILKDFDFVFVGRSCIGRPEFFAKIIYGKELNINFSDYLKLARKYNLPFRQIKFQAMNFTKCSSGARMKRSRIIVAKSVAELERIFCN